MPTNTNLLRYFRLACSLLLLTALSGVQVQVQVHADSSTVIIDDDVEIDILRIGQNAPVSIIWFTCNQGDESAEVKTAQKMASQGYQFYFPDMLSAHFLSPTPSNIARVPTSEISKVIQHVLQRSGSKEVFLMGGARAAVPVLKGLSDKKIINTKSPLRGALLITPRINKKTPVPGADPKYIDEAGLSSHPIMILEGERTPNRWGLPHLKATLEKSGSLVQTELIKGVRGFFYLRAEKTPDEVTATGQLDHIIHTHIEKLRTIKP